MADSGDGAGSIGTSLRELERFSERARRDSNSRLSVL
jgi:hypothetical protein